MSVVSKNPFALLDDAEDTSVAPAPAAVPAVAAPAPVTGQRHTNGRGGDRGRGRPPRATRDGEAKPSGDADARPRDGDRGRGRGGKRGDRGRGGDRRGGRGYDRHSHSARTDSEKQIAHVWGGTDAEGVLNDEVIADKDAALETATEMTGPTTKVEGKDFAAPGDATAVIEDAWAITEVADPAAEGTEGDKKAADGDKPRRRREEDEEDDNTLSYTQYLEKKKADENFALPKLEAREANDGEDALKLWKGATKKEAIEDEAYFALKTKSAPKARTEKVAKVFLDIEARYDPPSNGRGDRGRGSRGSRGGDRGDRRGGRGARGGDRGGRGGGRGGGNRGPALNVDDTTAFPSLS